MARLYTYEDAHDNTRWVVERSGFTGEGRREFDTYTEAKAYQDYLQSIEDREKALAQNDEIIANQKRLIELQGRQNSRPMSPQYTRPNYDPEYQEWLRFKKDTDPAFRRWKAEEERKRIQAENERQARQRQNEREREQRDYEYKLKNFGKIKERLSECERLYPKITSIYNKLLEINFVESRELEYETGYRDELYGGYEAYTFKINGGKLVFTNNITDAIKKSIDYIKQSNYANIDLNEVESHLVSLSKNFDKINFDKLYGSINELLKMFECFYGNVYAAAFSRNGYYDDYKSSYENKTWNPSPMGFFAKIRLQNALGDYLEKNKANYELVQTIT